MWEAEREFELYEEVQGYELEDEGTDDFLDLDLDTSADKAGFEYEEDLYDEDENQD